MLAEKKPLGVEELEAQTALELPDREMMLVQTGLVNVGIEDTNIALCANVSVNVANVGDVSQSCDAQAG